MKRYLRATLLFLAVLLAACATPAVEPDAVDSTSPAVSPSPTAAAEPATAQPPAAVAEDVIFGRLDVGAYYHGAPDAPVTLIDYSDFL